MKIKKIQKVIQFKHWQCIGVLLFLHANAHALLCPSNFNQIEEGYTKSQVERQCGKPIKINESEKQPTVPQEWTYYAKQPDSMEYGQQGSVKITMAFGQDGKLINITINGIGMQNMTLCSSSIQLNDSTEQVKAACGTPTMVTKQENDVQTGQPFSIIKIEEWVYNDPFNSVLVFENEKFVRVKE